MFTLKEHVANVCFKYFICFRGMLQVFYMDVAKVDWDVAYVASISEACCKSRSGCCICCKCFRGILRAFVQSVSSVSDICCKHFDMNVAYVSHICCKSMFQIF